MATTPEVEVVVFHSEAPARGSGPALSEEAERVEPDSAQQFTLRTSVCSLE